MQILLVSEHDTISHSPFTQAVDTAIVPSGQNQNYNDRHVIYGCRSFNRQNTEACLGLGVELAPW